MHSVSNKLDVLRNCPYDVYTTENFNFADVDVELTDEGAVIRYDGESTYLDYRKKGRIDIKRAVSVDKLKELLILDWIVMKMASNTAIKSPCFVQSPASSSFVAFYRGEREKEEVLKYADSIAIKLCTIKNVRMKHVKISIFRKMQQILGTPKAVRFCLPPRIRPNKWMAKRFPNRKCLTSKTKKSKTTGQKKRYREMKSLTKTLNNLSLL